MTQESKYYQPQIEEFHCGFKCEIQSSYGWQKGSYPDIFKQDTLSWDELNRKKAFKTLEENYKYLRVKYLDEDDIVSFGFGKQTIPNVFNDDEFTDGFTLTIDESNEILLYKDNLDVKIARQTVYNQSTGNWTADLLFQGKIKNKSELNRLLVQLGINKST